jgi:hypothetical protein
MFGSTYNIQRNYTRRKLQIKKAKEEEQARIAKEAGNWRAKEAKISKNTTNASVGSSRPPLNNVTQQPGEAQTSQPQNRILVASSLCPPHLLRPQPLRTGLASDLLVVVRLLKIPMVLIKSTLPIYNLCFHHAFADVLAFSLMCFPTPIICSHIFALPLLAFCAVRHIYPELLAKIAVLYCSP